MTGIASDIRRKRKQFEREVAKAARTRKVHCVSNLRDRHHLSACGQSIHCPMSVEQFVWLPAEVQCGRCMQANINLRLEATFGRPVSATPEMLIVVESIVVAFERLDQAAQLVPHKDRGCYFREIGKRCWCGRWSALDVSRWLGAVIYNNPVLTIRAELFERTLDRAIGHANPAERSRGDYVYEGPNGSPRPKRDVSPNGRLKESLGNIARSKV